MWYDLFTAHFLFFSPPSSLINSCLLHDDIIKIFSPKNIFSFNERQRRYNKKSFHETDDDDDDPFVSMYEVHFSYKKNITSFH